MRVAGTRRSSCGLAQIQASGLLVHHAVGVLAPIAGRRRRPMLVLVTHRYGAATAVRFVRVLDVSTELVT